MRTTSPEELASLFSDTPLVAALLVILVGASLVVAVAWPFVRKARMKQRIRHFPPPPVRVVKEPELKLPRRRSVDQPPGV